MIPITRLSVGEAEALAAAEVIRSRWLAQGKRTANFESLVAEYVGARHAIAVNSCTTALHLALIAAGVKPGDEVVCPSYSFIATANSIVYAGAKPVFVDIDPRIYNIDPALVERAITPKTTAIMPVSQIGLAADIPAIRRIADRHGIKIVEDAAPSLGAAIDGVRLGNGTLSHYTCFSFDARKILTTGEGGMVTTDDDEGAERLRNLRAHAASVPMLLRHTSSNVVLERYPEIGFNYKMTDIQGAIGVVQMGRVAEIIAERRRLARRYNQLLAHDPRIELPCEPDGCSHVYQSYCVRLVGKHSQLEVMQEMATRQIATRRIVACHLETYFRNLYPRLSLPHTEAATHRTLLLPLFVGLTEQEQDQVVDALLASLDKSDLSAGSTRRLAAVQ